MDTKNTEVCPSCLYSGMLLEILADEDEWHEAVREGQEWLLAINLSDTFHYASADSETVPKEELKDAFALRREHGRWGLVLWAAAKRGVKPLVEHCETLAGLGIPLPDGLADNPENADGERW